MLRTNSKKARQNVMNYICMNTCDSETGNVIYELIGKTERDVIKYLSSTFLKEHGYMLKRHSFYEAFKDWLQGLPSCHLGDFYNRYPVDAKEILKTLLEETEDEANKYEIEESENILSYLIAREIREFKEFKEDWRYWENYYRYEIN